jgi:type III restriction-modification system methyltransferase subunit
MIKDNILYNESAKPNSREIEVLKNNFPQYFDKDGNFYWDRFKEILKNEEITLNKEGYELNFLGKSYARYLSSTKTETFIVPYTEHNEAEENINSENLYIIGDNLDALKHLLGSYAGKIKCIYIDPPYNTGSDGFVYPDNFYFDARKLSQMIGVEEDEAQRIINLKGKSSHSAWMTFIYPRLILARELLSDDGVIFISIDDNEQANLKLMCDEIFGEENFEGHIHWRRRTNQPNDKTKLIGLVAEHIISYSKNSMYLKTIGVGKIPLTGTFSNPDNDYRGDWASKPWKTGSDQTGTKYTIITPTGVEYDEEWMGDRETYESLLKDNRIVFSRNGNGLPRKKYFKFEREEEGQCACNWFSSDTYGNNQEASDELDRIFGMKNIFTNPKPTTLLETIVSLGNLKKDDIVLDFFSGSGTIAHAVMKLNAEDGGNRKYILVQLPEAIKKDKPAYKEGYRTIDEIGRERIRRAANKIQEETGSNIDYGFKVYSLKSLEEEVLTNLDDFDDNPKLILDDMVGIFDTDKSKGKDAILSTYLALDGYGLSVNTQKYRLSNFEADKIENSIYMIDNGLDSDDVMELIKRIETLERDITRVVVYVPSLNFHVLHELKKNLSNLRNNKSVELIERY